MSCTIIWAFAYMLLKFVNQYKIGFMHWTLLTECAIIMCQNCLKYVRFREKRFSAGNSTAHTPKVEPNSTPDQSICQFGQNKSAPRATKFIFSERYCIHGVVCCIFDDAHGQNNAMSLSNANIACCVALWKNLQKRWAIAKLCISFGRQKKNGCIAMFASWTHSCVALLIDRKNRFIWFGYRAWTPLRVSFCQCFGSVYRATHDLSKTNGGPQTVAVFRA